MDNNIIFDDKTFLYASYLCLKDSDVTTASSYYADFYDWVITLNHSELEKFKEYLIDVVVDFNFLSPLLELIDNLLYLKKAACKCPVCSTEMKGIELTHYKCEKCNLYFTN